jgi:AraC-like DNA-binding protein
VNMVGMEFVRRAPEPALRGAVLRYTGFAEHAPGPVRSRELPCTYVPIVVDLDSGWRITDGRRLDDAVHLGSFVAGITDGPVLIEHPGSARCLQVDLAPLAARRLLGIPLSELANRWVALDDVFGRSARDLVERIADAPGWQHRFSIVERALAARLADAAPIDPGVAWSLAQLMASGGLAAIGGLADELGWSHRRLIARFRDAVGMTPKRVARIQRFERLTALIGREPRLDWATAAVACGFSDQAHPVREVRDLTGLTPTALREGRVNFVQDEAVVPA